MSEHRPPRGAHHPLSLRVGVRAQDVDCAPFARILYQRVGREPPGADEQRPPVHLRGRNVRAATGLRLTGDDRVTGRSQPAVPRSAGFIHDSEVRVVHVDENTSTAQIDLFCEQMQRGDIVQPFAARPAPNYKPVAKLDIFAPATRKEMAMVVTSRDFGQTAYTGKVVYVNLGSTAGVKVGDYYRIFRYEGDHHGTPYQARDQATTVYGFGSAPGNWQWMDLPREILGEGMVLSVSPNASTVLITDSLREIFAGDYVEVE